MTEILNLMKFFYNTWPAHSRVKHLNQYKKS